MTLWIRIELKCWTRIRIEVNPDPAIFVSNGFMSKHTWSLVHRFRIQTNFVTSNPKHFDIYNTDCFMGIRNQCSSNRGFFLGFYRILGSTGICDKYRYRYLTNFFVERAELAPALMSCIGVTGPGSSSITAKIGKLRQRGSCLIVYGTGTRYTVYL
jgi:hypothetical protein